ncbi:hypothetical protein CAP35_13310 [Chitinophagaceae bacterium IBVUCB1]|nr:hypothetical protein CAP35_13310 [Chitinophagaceae bacterium IBVUCB1]
MREVYCICTNITDMRQSLLALCCLLIVTSVNAQSDTLWFDADWEKTTNKDTAAYYRPAPARQANGMYLIKDYYKSGALQMEAYSTDANDNNINGLVKRYHENGQLESEVQYINGKGQGKYITYYANGKLESEEFYVNGERNGLCTFYREEDGSVESKIEYEKSLYSGNFIEYYKSGVIKRKDYWKKGKLKKGKYFDESGRETTYIHQEYSPEYPGGWNAYDNYIKNNIRYPLVCKEENVRGNVQLKVFFDTTGKVRRVIIDKSLHPDCDKEALRLIYNMPPFPPAKDYRGNKVARSGYLSVYFGKIPAGAFILDPVSSILRSGIE